MAQVIFLEKCPNEGKECVVRVGGHSRLAVPAVQTVELSDCERTQALALQVLLSLAKFNQHRIQEMDCYHGYSMIHQVLIKSKCIVGFHVLKVSRTFNPLPSDLRDLPETDLGSYFSPETPELQHHHS